jgi:hypothetical protein
VRLAVCPAKTKMTLLFPVVSRVSSLKLIHRRQLVKKDTADIVQSVVHRSGFG